MTYLNIAIRTFNKSTTLMRAKTPLMYGTTAIPKSDGHVDVALSHRKLSTGIKSHVIM